MANDRSGERIKRKNLFYLVVSIGLILITLGVYIDLINIFEESSKGIDFTSSFRPAVFRLLNGESPYGNDFGFYNPPWILLILLPIALLPPKLGAAVMFTLGLVGFAVAGFRTGWKPWTTGIVLMSKPVLWNSHLGNIDWLVAIGFTLPPQIGLFLVLLKPHLGIPVALYWLWEAWKKGRAKEVIRVFAPATLALAISFLVFGLYPFNATPFISNEYNYSIWPSGVVIGVVLLAMAISKNEFDLAKTASPFLSPYVTIQSWSLGLFGLNDLGAILASIVLWFFPIGV